jgi:ABC-type multidrug transport system fused ATPase/permease subunit
MWHQISRLLAPYNKDYLKYLLGVALRQSLAVLAGYLLVCVLRYCLGYRHIAEWVFIAGFLIVDTVLITLDVNLTSFFAKRLGYPLFGDLRTRALGKMLDLPLEWHHKQNSGALMGAVNNGVGKVVQTTESVSRELVPALIQSGLSLIPLLIWTPLATPIMLVAFAIFVPLTFFESRKRQPLRRSRYLNYTRDSGFFSECVQSVQPVIQFGQQTRMLNEYSRIQKEILGDGLKETSIGNRFSVQRNLTLAVARRVCQGIWIWQYRQGTIDIALVLYLNMLTEQLLASFWSYASLFDRIFEGLEPARILVTLLEEKPSITSKESAKPVTVPPRVGIELVNVRFGYSNGSEVIRDMRLKIEPGSIVGIVGRSGCGKTTLHGLMTRLFSIDQGRILVGGTDVEDWPLDQLRGTFAYVTQSGGAFFSGMSVLDVLRFARPDATVEEVTVAANIACIHEDIERMPFRYATILGERGVNISRGQQQRIALAQALLSLGSSRKILVLDEFTSALDAETERRVLANLRPLLRERTAIIVAHRLSTIREIADKIVVLDKGDIIEEGTHTELLERGGWYADMVKLQRV